MRGRESLADERRRESGDTFLEISVAGGGIGGEQLGHGGGEAGIARLERGDCRSPSRRIELGDLLETAPGGGEALRVRSRHRGQRRLGGEGAAGSATGAGERYRRLGCSASIQAAVANAAVACAMSAGTSLSAVSFAVWWKSK